MRISALAVTLLSTLCVAVFCANVVSAQNLRRQMRIQKKIDKRLNRPANPNRRTAPNGANEEPVAPNQFEAPAPRAAARQGGQSVDGIRQRGIRTLFTQEEISLMIPGFSKSPVALMVILRQLDLTPDQKVKIRDLRRQVGNQLGQTRRELNQLEIQLEEAIYGNLDPASLDNYDPVKVKELSEQVIQKQAEWSRLQTDIESQFRQILTPDQFFVFRELARELVRPGSRPLVNPALRQQRQQQRMGIQPNQQNRPNQQDKPDSN
jgi:Spy/CpxP family protein refolding chaperone